MQTFITSRLVRALLIALVWVSGCVSGGLYPASWAPQVQVTSGACPVIDGLYQDIGEAFTKSGNDESGRTAHSLTHLLDGWGSDNASRSPEIRLGTTHFEPAQDPLRIVRLRQTGAELHIQASFADGSSREFSLETRGRCRDSTLLLESIVPSSEDFEYGRETLALGRGEDNSLLAHWSSTAVIFILGPNWVSRHARWIRFAPVLPASVPRPVPAGQPAEKQPGGRSGTGSPVLSGATAPQTD